MTAAKSVSTALTSLLDNPLVKTILDRSADIAPVIEEVKSWWGYDLHARKPSPAYNEAGLFTGTDLDLACFLYELAGRDAVINIPTYKGHSKKKERKDQVVTSQYNRHGKLINVGAHKDFFSFNIKIIDENVVGEDKVGEFRTFSLTDKNGAWYDGWKTIQFNPTLRENRFLTENSLWTGNQIYFKNFIHPNRWTSVFGQHYAITKLLMDRLDDEAKFLNAEVKRLKAAGVTFPAGDGPADREYEYGKGVQKKFTAFEMQLYVPDAKFSGTYRKFEEATEDLVRAYKTRTKMVYSDIPQLRFMTRASEYAHFQAPDRFPAWMKNVKWEDGFKIPPRGRTVYQRLKLFQDKVGEHSISLLKRTYEKSATVGAD
jgi:hypothetical protein